MDAAAKMQKAANTPYGIYPGNRKFWYLPLLLSKGVTVLNSGNTAQPIPALRRPRSMSLRGASPAVS
jgi:hypothetical protein